MVSGLLGALRKMNGQNRSQLPDYSKINPAKHIQTLDNYRGYSKILFLRPFSNTYMGYLDDDFFGYKVREKDNMKFWLMDIKEAVDYYLDKIFFHSPVLEFDMFYSLKDYRIYVNALVVAKEKAKKQ